ncbi:MAG: Asp/Glu racemase [Paracoccaceae bacterium]
MTPECTFDAGHAGGNAMGLVVLQTDETLEVESRAIFSAAGVACYHARIPSHAQVTSETLALMRTDLPQTAALLPAGAGFGAIGYGCTSGATVIGQAAVAEMINHSHPDVRVSDPITAVMAALNALGVRRIGLLTPYVPEVTGAMQALMAKNGFEILRVASFEQIEDRSIARIAESSTLAAIEEIGSDPACDAVFASCTNLRTFTILKAAESSLGKPVVSSNQALCWHMLGLADVPRHGMGPGCLFDR